MPSKYIRDAVMVCSEAVAEVFWRNGLDMVSGETILLPEDFARSKSFDKVNEHVLLIKELT